MQKEVDFEVRRLLLVILSIILIFVFIWTASAQTILSRIGEGFNINNVKQGSSNSLLITIENLGELSYSGFKVIAEGSVNGSEYNVLESLLGFEIKTFEAVFNENLGIVDKITVYACKDFECGDVNTLLKDEYLVGGIEIIGSTNVQYVTPSVSDIITTTTLSDVTTSYLVSDTSYPFNFNKEILRLNNEYQGAVASELLSILAQMRLYSNIRKQEMTRLAQEDPEAFLALVFSSEEKDTLPLEIRDLTERIVTITGKIEVLHVDDFDDISNSRFYYFLVVDGRRLQFYPTKFLPIRSGAVVKVQGYQLENIVVADKDAVSLVAGAPGVDSIGEQKTLVFLIDFPDSGPRPFTIEQAHDIIFNRQFQKFYHEQSYNNVFFSGDVYGWFTFDGGDGCGVIEDKIDDLILANNINIDNYERIVILPNHPSATGGCSYVGKIELDVNGIKYNKSIAWIGNVFNYNEPSLWGEQPFEWTNLDLLLSHELGHSLGVLHANGWDCGDQTLLGDCRHLEYKNPFDTMGTRPDTFSLHFNAYYKEFLGWIPTEETVIITKSGRYVINPLELDSAKKLAKIQFLQYPQILFYLEYRKALGFDSNLNREDILSNQFGLLVNKHVFDSVQFRRYGEGNYPRLLDMSPTFREWGEDIKAATINVGIEPFSSVEDGITIGPVISTSDSDVTFDAMIGQPVCVRREPIIELDKDLTIALGGSANYRIGISNQDSIICEPLNFSINIIYPKEWGLSVDQRYGYINPGERWSGTFILNIPSNISLGNYTIQLEIINIDTGGIIIKNTNVTVVSPPIILQVIPETGTVGTLIRIVGTGFSTNKNEILLSGTNVYRKASVNGVIYGDYIMLVLEVPSKVFSFECDCFIPTPAGTYNLMVTSYGAGSNLFNFLIIDRGCGIDAVVNDDNTCTAYISDVNNDGYIFVENTGMTRFENTDEIIIEKVSSNPYNFGYVEWNVSKIPSYGRVSKVSFRYNGLLDTSGGATIRHLPVTSPVSEVSNDIILDSAIRGTRISNIGDWDFVKFGVNTIDLTSEAIDLVQLHKDNVGLFAVAMFIEGALTTTTKISSSEAGGINIPTIVVNYTVPQECGNYIIELGEECDDGNLINGDGCSINCKLECTLQSAFWDGYRVAEGQLVNLTVSGSTGCASKSISFQVFEDDILQDEPANNNPPSTVFNVDRKAKSQWIAERPYDGGDPEFYFIATLDEDPSISIQSDLLTVIANIVDVIGWINTYRAIANQENPIIATINNNGAQDASDVIARFYTLDREWNGSDYIETNLQLIDEEFVGSLISNEYRDITFTWIPTQSGYQNVKLEIEAPGDGNLENNVAYNNINVVIDAPDLSGYVLTKFVFVNQRNTVVALLSNYGVRENTGGQIKLYKRSERFIWNGSAWIEDLTLIGRNLIGFMLPDESKEINFTWIPTELGWQNLKLIIENPYDGNLENNVAYNNIQVVTGICEYYMIVNNNVTVDKKVIKLMYASDESILINVNGYIAAPIYKGDTRNLLCGESYDKCNVTITNVNSSYGYANVKIIGINCGTICGNAVIEEGERCELGNTLQCTINGYPGTRICNNKCSRYNECTTSLYCGDGRCNGAEKCDYCVIDCGRCKAGPTIGCGNGICEEGELKSCISDCIA